MVLLLVNEENLKLSEGGETNLCKPPHTVDVTACEAWLFLDLLKTSRTSPPYLRKSTLRRLLQPYWSSCERHDELKFPDDDKRKCDYHYI